MADRTVHHATFAIERHFDAPPATVFRAFADPAAKRRWFVEGEGWTIERYAFDFRPGGEEGGAFRYKDGPLVSNETLYQDIVENRRIAFSYVMKVEGAPISASQATVELLPEGAGTRMIYTEQGAYLDGTNTPADREAGCAGLFDALDVELKRKQAA